MSNAALAVVIVGVALAFVIWGTKGVQRTLLVLGLCAIALLVYLIWAGKLSISDIKNSLSTTPSVQPGWENGQNLLALAAPYSRQNRRIRDTVCM